MLVVPMLRLRGWHGSRVSKICDARKVRPTRLNQGTLGSSTYLPAEVAVGVGGDAVPSEESSGDGDCNSGASLYVPTHSILVYSLDNDTEIEI